VANRIEAVYLPHNEPYLGLPALLAFDQAIPGAMQQNSEIARHTFEIAKSPAQDAVCELAPQVISIALSIRELLRQAYLFSAVILLRPMLERLALVVYLRDTPEAVAAWHNGWDRKAQPSFDTLVHHLVSANLGSTTEEQRKQFASLLHKAVHPTQWRQSGTAQAAMENQPTHRGSWWTSRRFATSVRCSHIGAWFMQFEWLRVCSQTRSNDFQLFVKTRRARAGFSSELAFR
jgi:hypothetical protein